VASGQYYWNSGMFLFKASRYLQELERLNPAMLAGSRRAWEQAKRDSDFTRLDRDLFSAVASDSIDYAVMEKTQDAVVVPLDAGWNDVGSWTALRDVSPRDADGNAHKGDVIAIDCRNTYVYGERLVALVGLDDVVVVETDDAILVGKADRMQEVKDVVARLKAESAARPRGTARSTDRGARMTRSTMASVSRSSASRSSPAAR
jgi:Mannose-1-phosphate guanylyltransferase